MRPDQSRPDSHPHLAKTAGAHNHTRSPPAATGPSSHRPENTGQPGGARRWDASRGTEKRFGQLMGCGGGGGRCKKGEENGAARLRNGQQGAGNSMTRARQGSHAGSVRGRRLHGANTTNPLLKPSPQQPSVFGRRQRRHDCRLNDFSDLRLSPRSSTSYYPRDRWSEMIFADQRAGVGRRSS